MAFCGEALRSRGLEADNDVIARAVAAPGSGGIA